MNGEWSFERGRRVNRVRCDTFYFEPLISYFFSTHLNGMETLVIIIIKTLFSEDDILSKSLSNTWSSSSI